MPLLVQARTRMPGQKNRGYGEAEHERRRIIALLSPLSLRTSTLTSTPSVVVTVDADTGQVDVVAPASTARPASAKNADGTLTYKAAFKAIYDAKGRNLAPNGASSLTVNQKSGKLVRFA
jgi:hypothetical protein